MDGSFIWAGRPRVPEMDTDHRALSLFYENQVRDVMSFFINK